jgi:transposase InsO family protein
MSKARLIITAVTIEGRSQHEVARAYGISQSWVSRLVARYRAEGEAAFQPRSRRPKTNPTAIAPATVTLITELRAKLTTAGLDAGPDTIAWHLAHHHNTRVSTATISRYLTRLGLVSPQPTKRPKASYQRFQAQLPNQCWQADFTHYPLTGPPDGPPDAPARDTEILTWLDDHSRYALDVTAHQPVTGPIVRDRFLASVARFGPPASTLTDNGMVFTTRFAGGRGGRNALEAELRHRNVQQKNSRPNKPTTCGKVERFQQTLKQWLRAQPHQPTNLAQLQQLLDQFVAVYNQQRPHRSPPGRTTPAVAYQARPKAAPAADLDHHTHDRVRHDRIDTDGKVTLRVNGRLHHIGIGRTHARTPVLLLVQDLHVRVVNAATGELLRELIIDPARDYQPIHPPRARTTSPRTHTKGSG